MKFFIPLIATRRSHLALLAMLVAPSVWAIQPAEAGLQPLYARAAEIQTEQLALIRKLESLWASSASKTYAHRQYLVLGEERSRIDSEIAQAQWMANSGLVNYAGPPDTSGAGSTQSRK